MTNIDCRHILITLPAGVSLQRATDFAEYLQHRYGAGAGLVPKGMRADASPMVYAVRPGDMSEDLAVFTNNDDAEAWRATFESVGDVEECVLIDQDLAAQMVADRTEDDEMPDGALGEDEENRRS